MTAVILAAAEHVADRSEAPFFIAGSLLVIFAVAVSVLGFTRPGFPGSAAASRGVMALATVLVVASMAAAVYVSS